MSVYADARDREGTWKSKAGGSLSLHEGLTGNGQTDMYMGLGTAHFLAIGKNFNASIKIISTGLR